MSLDELVFPLSSIKQRGAGGMPIYYGARYQKGMGLGSMFKNFFRWIMPVVKTHAVPILKDAAKYVGSEALKTATSLTTDALGGNKINETVKEHAKEVMDNMNTVPVNPLESQVVPTIKEKRKRKLICKRKSITKRNNYKDVFSK
jgi:hypothetical protein